MTGMRFPASRCVLAAYRPGIPEMQRVRVLDAFALVHVVHDVAAGADEGENVGQCGLQ